MGPDGCGSSCGTCPSGDACNATGQCTCTPNCQGKQCGPDGCGGQCPPGCPRGASCNANGECPAFLYWGNPTIETIPTIGRANLDGTGVDQRFITELTGSNPWGVAVNATHIYWSNFAIGTIGRANLDGTGVNERLIENLENPTGVAVTAVPVDCGGSAVTIDATGRRDCDGNACTIGDACVAATCQPGSPLTAGVLSDVILERSDHVAAGTCAADKKKRVKKILAPLSKTAKRLRAAFTTDNPSRARRKISAAGRSHEQAAKSLPKQQSHLSAACVAELNANIESARRGLICLP